MDTPEGFDPNVAYIMDESGKVYQELAPVETITVVVGRDNKGKPITETVELPREWDEAATVEVMKDG